MTVAHFCGNCGDTMSNHRKRTFKGDVKYFNQYFECQVDGCDCSGFIEKMVAIPRMSNYGK